MLGKLGKTTEVKRGTEDVEAPRGQFVTEKFPVLTAVPGPEVDIGAWRLRIFGMVEEELELTWEQLMALPQVTVDAAFHCVTQWSRLRNTWRGVLFSEVMRLARPSPKAKFVMVYCYGGYTTNLPLEDIVDEVVLFAHQHGGEPLTRGHGGPLRLVVPKLYGWKSAKWVRGVELMERNRPGFWEERGYHMRGDAWKEERFWPDLS